MRILIISYFFPPYNTIGAVRVGKTAKWLHEMGHEIKVVSARNQPLQATLELEIPRENVVYTNWININALPELVLGGRSQVAAEGFTPKGHMRNMMRGLGKLYKTVLNFPDGQIGWYPYGLREARRLLKKWKPDVIFASAMPYTSLLIARQIAHEYHLPWVAELRDLWTDNHYYQYFGLRKHLEKNLERKVLGSANGIVTVSEPLAETLRRKYTNPIEVILNGFDPLDYKEIKPMVCSSDDNLLIIYTGSIYEGKRDPSPLFVALTLMGDEADNIRVEFYGRNIESVRLLVKQYGVERLVSVYPSIPYGDALTRQKEADVLLLLLWNDPREKGVYTGKLFEYLGAGRPILAIGSPDNVAAELIMDRSAGVVAVDPAKIAEALKRWYTMKREGKDFSVDNSRFTDLTRQRQTTRLADFLARVIADNKLRS